MNTDKTSVSSSVLIPLMSYAEEHGLSIRTICDDTGIEAAKVNDANSRIDLNRVDALLETIASQTKEPLLGVKIGYRLGTRSYNLLQHLMIVCPNLMEAIHKQQEYHILFSDEPVPTFESNESACITFHFQNSEFPVGSQIRMLTCVAAQRFWLGFKCGKAFVPNCIELRMPHPGILAAEIERVMGCEVKFDRSEDAIHFDNKWLYLDSPFYNKSLLTLMEKETLALKLMLDSQSTRVANTIREALKEGRLSYRLSIEQAADYIGVSARTLNRYLSHEGTNFKNLLNEERIALANKLLIQGNSCLEDIAQDVGYSSRRSFDRAFTLSVGYSPAQARNKVSVVPQLGPDGP